MPAETPLPATSLLKLIQPVDLMYKRSNKARLGWKNGRKPLDKYNVKSGVIMV